MIVPLTHTHDFLCGTSLYACTPLAFAPLFVWATSQVDFFFALLPWRLPHAGDQKPQLPVLTHTH
jgi:hypothetical protein